MTTTFTGQGFTQTGRNEVLNPATNGMRRDVAMNRLVTRRATRAHRRAVRAI